MKNIKSSKIDNRIIKSIIINKSILVYLVHSMSRRVSYASL